MMNQPQQGQPYGGNPYPGQQYVRPPQHEEHLKMLSIFHYVLGGLGVFFSCIPLIHLTVGLFMVFGVGDLGQEAHGDIPTGIGWFFVVLGSLFFLMGQTISILMIATGRCLAKRRRYTFAFVIACIECILLPLGTILGIFTIMTLNKVEVKALFEHQADRQAGYANQEGVS